MVEVYGSDHESSKFTTRPGANYTKQTFFTCECNIFSCSNLFICFELTSLIASNLENELKQRLIALTSRGFFLNRIFGFNLAKLYSGQLYTHVVMSNITKTRYSISVVVTWHVIWASLYFQEFELNSNHLDQKKNRFLMGMHLTVLHPMWCLRASRREKKFTFIFTFDENTFPVWSTYFSIQVHETKSWEIYFSLFFHWAISSIQWKEWKRP